MRVFNIKHTGSRQVRNLLFVLPFSIGFFLSSCKSDFLDAESQTSASTESAFSSPGRVLAQVNGLYATVKNGNFLGGRYLVYNDIRAEDFIARNTNGVTGYTAWQHTDGADDSYIANFWITGYLAINRANILLEGLEANASNLDAAVVKNYSAEAKFVRALAYLSLVQVYANPYVKDNGASPGLPLRLKPETTAANNDLPKSTVAQVYAQILKDLNEAEADIPLNYPTPATSSAALNVTRAHKSTVIALKSRVYLAMGKYPDVITEANKLVSAAAPFVALSAAGVAHKLQDNIAAVYTSYTTTESIFSLPMAATNAPGTQNQLGFYYNGGNGGREYYLNPSSPGIYANPQWEADDARKTALTSTISGQVYVTKFAGVSPFIDWVPVLRWPEVLLNLAEAEAEAGSQTRAIALLQAVHNRSDATWSYSGTTKQDLINAILTERRIELISEGFRSNDIARRGQSMVSVGANSTIAPSDARYLFKIPTAELLNNTQL